MHYQWPSAGSVHIMGIINTTPDSFSDGGRFLAPDKALAQAELLLKDGADLLDIGGESTRPGAQAVSAQEELDRVMPVLTALRALAVPLSIDTSKPVVMRAAIEAGVAIVNDVNALGADGAIDCVANSTVAVCLMHRQGDPQTMQLNPHYHDVVAEVGAYLSERARCCVAAGIERSRLALDPGFGFGKNLSDNLRLLRHLPTLTQHGPVLVGLSRKRLLGEVLGRAVDERLLGSVVLALLAAQNGARVLRVHDVKETREALTLWQAVTSAS